MKTSLQELIDLAKKFAREKANRPEEKVPADSPERKKFTGAIEMFDGLTTEKIVLCGIPQEARSGKIFLEKAKEMEAKFEGVRQKLLGDLESDAVRRAEGIGAFQALRSIGRMYAEQGKKPSKEAILALIEEAISRQVLYGPLPRSDKHLAESHNLPVFSYLGNDYTAPDGKKGSVAGFVRHLARVVTPVGSTEEKMKLLGNLPQTDQLSVKELLGRKPGMKGFNFIWPDTEDQSYLGAESDGKRILVLRGTGKMADLEGKEFPFGDLPKKLFKALMIRAEKEKREAAEKASGKPGNVIPFRETGSTGG